MNHVFKSYKNKHKGERVFLVANGPSLKDTDLDLIKGEVSFAMNRVSMLYDSTEWRPTYYLFSSTNVRPSKPWAKQWQMSVRESMGEEKITSFVARIFKPFVDPFDDFKETLWFDTMTENKPTLEGLIRPECFSTNVVDRIDKTGTTMNLALQLCYYMGFSEIVFIGADLGWSKDEGTNSDPNHFDKNYVAEILRPEKVNHQMRNVHSLSLEYFQNRTEHEVKFYNASARTVLDVYPIIDYKKYVVDNVVEERKEDLESAKAFWDKPPQYACLT